MQNHHVTGKLNIDGEIYNFDRSPGYIEKDWGGHSLNRGSGRNAIHLLIVPTPR